MNVSFVLPQAAARAPATRGTGRAARTPAIPSGLSTPALGSGVSRPSAAALFAAAGAKRSASLSRGASKMAARADATRVDHSCGTSGPSLTLMRHGESQWNQRNLFTGCVDVTLTENGINEAIKAGKRIADVPVDVIFVSQLVRAQMTALIAMTQHTPGKVPIVQHTEDERAIKWSEIFSEDTMKTTIPVIRSFELNERMYGELQGLNKKETADKYGPEQVNIWRRSYDVPPPNGESLEMTAARSVKYFKEEVEPLLKAGKNVLISAHGNSLRAIIMYLEDLTPEEVVLLELFTAIPMVYEYIDGQYVTRGSPLEENVPGVYAVSPGLAKYKNILETMEKGYSS